jgi:FkbM family methyltransferase
MPPAYTEYTNHLQLLKNNGFSPKLVIDVGVSNGEFFYECQKIFTRAEYMLFEARKEEETTIKEILSEVAAPYDLYFNTLLGKGWQDDVNFYQLDAGSSVYQENTKFPREVVKKNIRPLASYLIEKYSEENPLPLPIFLKIDTQGSEIDILKGLSVYLEFVEVIQVEVALQNYNEGAPGVYDVHKFMDENDFKLYDLASAFRRDSDGAIFHMDWVFAAERSQLWQKNYFWKEELKYE